MRPNGSVTCGPQAAARGDRRSPADAAPPRLGHGGLDAPLGRALARGAARDARDDRPRPADRRSDRRAPRRAWSPTRPRFPHDADDACLVRVARRRWEKKRRIPTDLAAEIAGAQVESYQAWVKAREEASFDGLSDPSLERMLELQRRLIECFAPYDDPYDVALDDYEEGTRTPRTCASSSPRCSPRSPRSSREHANDEDEDEFLRGPFAIPPQEALSRELIERFGATWDAFRLDLTVHPFAAPVGLRDIRLTTRYARGRPELALHGHARVRPRPLRVRDRARLSSAPRSRAAPRRRCTSRRAGSGRTSSAARFRSGAGSTLECRRRSRRLWQTSRSSVSTAP